MEQPIYKIYSRKRLNFGFRRNGRFYNRKNNRFQPFNSRKIKKAIPILTIIILAFIIFNTILRSINPVFETLAKDEAKVIATRVTNEETSNVMNKYNYETFFTIEKDEKGEIQMISANVLKINQVTSDIAINIQNSLRKNKQKKISIAIGSISGIKILAGVGPKIPVRLSSAGTVETNLRSEFIAQGVNQTIHRVYIDVNSTVDILTPFSTLSETINNQVLILENVILGKIPSNYYDFDGINNSNQALELLE